MNKKIQEEAEKELTGEEIKHYTALIDRFKKDEHLNLLRTTVQHGITTTLEHCENVAMISLLMNKKYKIGANEEELVENAMLHDYYLYDWRKKKWNGGKLTEMHGFTHPGVASQNATRDFHINERQQDAIRAHMWPLTITQYPKDREAFILCMADKYATWVETRKTALKETK